MRKKKLIWRSIPWIFAAGLIAALVIFVGIPLYGQQETEEVNPPVIAYYEGDSAPWTMENEYLLFEMDPMTTQFTVTDKVSGHVWRSNPADAAKDPIALSLNKDMLSSTLIVTYTTSGGEVGMNNYTYSILNGSYTLSREEDGAIRADYAVGQIERVFLIPTAITKERYTALTDKMSKATKKKLASNYTLIEPDKLDKKENKDELIAAYPSVTEQALYILKDSTSTSNKEKIEGYFAEAGYTQEDYDTDQQLVAGAKTNNGPVFNVSMIYRLDGADLVVEIPYEAIRYRADYPITYLSPLPMFGAAGTADKGYLLIPEGGGAVINYNNGKLSQSTYYANLYGWDYGVQRKEAVSETENAFPVFGAARTGENDAAAAADAAGVTGDDGTGYAFLCIMEGASSYAGVSADIAGRYNSYNTVYAKYNVLHAEQYNVSNKTAQLVYVYEKQIPTDTIRQRYRFVSSGNYAELAAAYGEYLREAEPTMRDATASEEMPIHVELIGAINKNVVKFGMPVDSVVPATTFAQAQKIIDEFASRGIGNLNVRMTGWMNGGVRQEVLTGVHVLGELGGEGELKKLIAGAKERGVTLYLNGITAFAYHSGLFQGFLPFRDAARYATREQVHLYPYDIVTYQPADWLEDYYLTRPGYAKANATNLIRFLAERDVPGIAFRDIGNLLSADYYPRDLVTREQVKQMNVETLKEAAAAGQKVAVKEGNDYAVPYADLITDMNLTGQAYAIIDERIPFYQIALHGMKDYTGEAINLSGDYRTKLLECAEYGAGLNFTFMAENTRILQDSSYSCYTSSGFEYWREQAMEMITRYQREMRGLNRLRIVGHERLAEEVAVTVYEDGTKVYVNYGSAEYTGDGITIPDRDYVVERGNGK